MKKRLREGGEGASDRRMVGYGCVKGRIEKQGDGRGRTILRDREGQKKDKPH